MRQFFGILVMLLGLLLSTESNGQIIFEKWYVGTELSVGVYFLKARGFESVKIEKLR